jgi:hypothetical protein
MLWPGRGANGGQGGGASCADILKPSITCPKPLVSFVIQLTCALVAIRCCRHGQATGTRQHTHTESANQIPQPALSVLRISYVCVGGHGVPWNGGQEGGTSSADIGKLTIRSSSQHILFLIKLLRSLGAMERFGLADTTEERAAHT